MFKYQRRKHHGSMNSTGDMMYVCMNVRKGEREKSMTTLHELFF